MSQTIRGQAVGSSEEVFDRQAVLERAVGKCKTVEIKLQGVEATCLLDTGSQVHTISESFFNKHWSGKDSKVHPAFEWLKITAANGLNIRYIGYVELEVETMGITIPERGFLIVRDLENSPSVPCLLGMNVISKCRELVHSQFDTTLEKGLESSWRESPDC